MVVKLRLHELLEERGLTQRQLAEMSGVRQDRISQISRGFVSRIELSHIDAICDSLHVYPWEWIVYANPKDSTIFSEEDRAKALALAERYKKEHLQK